MNASVFHVIAGVTNAPAGAKAPAATAIAAATWPDFSDGNLGPDSTDDNLGPDSTDGNLGPDFTVSGWILSKMV